jgi:hypothetical protein
MTVPAAPPTRRRWFRFGPPDRRRGVATLAWYTIGGLLAVTSLMWGSLQTVGVLAHDQRDERIEVPADQLDLLEIRSDNGRVDLVRGDEDVVVVQANVSDGLVATDFSATTVDGTLVVGVGCSWLTGPWCRADLRIEVPPTLAVDVRTGTGRITATALDGSLVAASDTGSIRSTNLASSIVDATSGAGEIVLRFTEAPEEVRATSDARSVTVVVPDDQATYRVDASSESGPVRTEVRTDPSSRRTIEVRGSSRATVRY